MLTLPHTRVTQETVNYYDCNCVFINIALESHDRNPEHRNERERYYR